MAEIKAFNCYACNSLILSTSEREIYKFRNLSFVCENCGHLNFFSGERFCNAINKDPYLRIVSISDLI